jgi:hypothetical protein
MENAQNVTQRADYTDDEWIELTDAAETVGLGMLAVSRSGLIGKLRELATLSRRLSARALPGQFRDNELVLALVDSLGAQSHRLGTALGHSRGGLADLIAVVIVARMRLYSCCEQVAALLAAKASPAEAEGVKSWLLWIATGVAEASGDRWLGLGRKVSDDEARALSQIAVALQSARAPILIPYVARIEVPMYGSQNGHGRQ